MRTSRFIKQVPENFLSKERVKSVYAGRRGFMAGAFASAILDTEFTPSGVARIGQLQSREKFAYTKP